MIHKYDAKLKKVLKDNLAYEKKKIANT